MISSTINNVLIAADYMPCISLLTKTTGVFLKLVVENYISPQFIANHSYCRHLQNKPFIRFIILLVPPVGNIVVALSDCIVGAAALGRRHDRNALLDIVYFDSSALNYSSKELQNSRDFILGLVRQNGLLLQYVKAEFKSDADIVRLALAQNRQALQYASTGLQQRFKAAI